MPGARSRAEAGKLCFGTVDSWLIWNLTGGRMHVTDASNASRTMLFNIHNGDWDDELLGFCVSRAAVLPKVVASSEVSGRYGDGICSVRRFRSPASPATSRRRSSGRLRDARHGEEHLRHRLFHADEHRRAADRVAANDCSPQSPGALTKRTEIRAGGQRLHRRRGGAMAARRARRYPRPRSEVEALAAQRCPTTAASISCRHSPGWARRIGIRTRAAHRRAHARLEPRAHLARAALEVIAYQMADILERCRRDSGIALEELRVDGGAARNDLLMQFQADILGVPVVRPGRWRRPRSARRIWPD